MVDRRLVLFLLALLAVLLSACGGIAEAGDDDLTASGTIAADDVKIASQTGGQVLEVVVEEGDQVQVGDVLLRIDDALLHAQVAQASAGVTAAAAAVETAQAQLGGAQTQYALALQGARLQARQAQAQGMDQMDQTLARPDAFDLPAWYFEKEEEIAAAREALQAAQAALDGELAALREVLEEAGHDEFIAAEARLAQAQAAFQAAQGTFDQFAALGDHLTQARAQFEAAQDALETARTAYESGAGEVTQAQLAEAQTGVEQAQAALAAAEAAAADSEWLETAAREALESAREELDAAQAVYDDLLSTATAQDVLQARARVAVTRARLQNAQDALDLLLTGEESLQVQAARGAVEQAEAGVAQAEAGLAQAQAALDLVEIQLEKAVVTAPAAGVVLARNVAPGETIGPGVTVLVIGQLDEVELTVYVPENQYGRVKLGQRVAVRVDSFPEQVFEGTVVSISDQAVFTPRNVQTVEGRSSTVYGVLIRLPNPEHHLKPGMPADAEF